MGCCTYDVTVVGATAYCLLSCFSQGIFCRCGLWERERNLSLEQGSGEIPFRCIGKHGHHGLAGTEFLR